MKRRQAVWCALAVAAAMFGLSVFSPSAIAGLDLRAYDELLRHTAGLRATGRVAIVVVDEKSIAEIGQWPWSRDVLAQLIENLHGLGAGTIALDIILSEPDRLGSPGTDAALAGALGRHHVVTSFAFTFDAADERVPDCALHPLQVVRIDAPDQESRRQRLFEPSGIICSLPVFSRAAAASGFLNITRDRDGVVRRIPMVMEYRGEIYPSLALAAMQRLSGTSRMTLSAAGDRRTLDIAGHRMPLDAQGNLLIRFPSPGLTIRYVSAADVLRGRLPAGSFADQVVFVGGTALGVSHVVATPLDASYPGLEVHAAVVESLIANRFVALPAYRAAYDGVTATAAALAVAAFIMAGGLLWGGLLTAISSLALWRAVSWAFARHDMFLSPVLPLLSAAMSFAVLTVAKVVHERQRAEVEKRRRQQAYRFIVQSLTSLTETRDVDTGRHARRTQGYTRLVGNLLIRSPRFRGRLTPEHVELMAILAPLHDIGKVGIPDAVLNKPGPLTPEEFAQMRTHPRLGFNAIANAEALSLIEDEEILGLAKDLVFTHHEWWDGRGYPRGLAGDEIPIGGRILAVVDVYDALVAPRPYRVPLPHEQAVNIIRAQRGTHFDPDVVDAFVAVEHEIERLSNTAA